MKFEEARMTSRGRVTIPKSIRTQLRLKPGRSVLFIPKGRGFIIKPKVKVCLKKLGGVLELFGKFDFGKPSKEIIKEIKEGWKD